MYVTEQVVADVQDLGLGVAEALLDEPGVPAHVHATGFERADVGTQQGVLFVLDPVGVRALGEETGFGRRHDDDVEQVAPCSPVAEGIEGVVHDLAGVGPLGVGDQQQFLSRRPLILERLYHLGFEVHEPFGVGEDLGLERAGDVRFGQRLADCGAQGLIAADRGQSLLIEEVDQLAPAGWRGTGRKGCS